MKRTIFALFFVLFLFSACASSSGLIGSWTMHGDLDWHIEFLNSNDGIEIFEGQEFRFNWNLNGSFLEINLIGDQEGSYLADIFSREVHGTFIDSFIYNLTDPGNWLILSDSHGHSHIQYTFLRN